MTSKYQAFYRLVLTNWRQKKKKGEYAKVMEKTFNLLDIFTKANRPIYFSRASFVDNLLSN